MSAPGRAGAASLGADAKDALARDIPEALHCRAALLAALAYYGSPDGQRFETRRNGIARMMRNLLLAHRVGDATRAHITTHRERRLRALPVYTVELPPHLALVAPLPSARCDRIAEVRGAFLACGSLAVGVSGYHLEFFCRTQTHADRLARVLRSLRIAPKSVVRKSRPVLYYKEFEAIAQLLASIGAHAALLELEDVRALRETKNRIHRLVNTEAANLDRVVAAAGAQARLVGYLASAYGLARLSAPLREVAELRLAHPEESLAELGTRCRPAIGKQSVSSRFSALGRLARELQNPSRKEARTQAK